MPADIVSRLQRSRMMSGIRGKNTKPELAIRSALHQKGFRFRLHRKDLPGRPDLVFPRYHAVIFVHGCFWHRHECNLFKWPATRQDFWREKIERNATRDGEQCAKLLRTGWRIAIVWECSIRGRASLPFAEVVEKCALWLTSDAERLEIRGNETRAAR